MKLHLCNLCNIHRQGKCCYKIISKPNQIHIKNSNFWREINLKCINPHSDAQMLNIAACCKSNALVYKSLIIF